MSLEFAEQIGLPPTDNSGWGDEWEPGMPSPGSLQASGVQWVSPVRAAVDAASIIQLVEACELDTNNCVHFNLPNQDLVAHYGVGVTPPPLDDVYPSWWPQSAPQTPEDAMHPAFPTKTPPKPIVVAHVFESGPYQGGSYEGGWLDGKMHGEGILHMEAACCTFYGKFVDGLEQGPGTIVHQSGGTQRVLWHKGAIIDVLPNDGQDSDFPLVSNAWGCDEASLGKEKELELPLLTPPAEAPRPRFQSKREPSSKKASSLTRSRKPPAKSPSQKAKKDRRPGDWACPCGNVNFARRDNCNYCDQTSAKGYHYAKCYESAEA